jgi:hypothetical protein
MNYYVYELICKETNKWYVGCQIGKYSDPEKLGVNYFTSSKFVKPLFKLNPKSFIKKILVQSNDLNYIYKVETDILKFRNAKDDPMSWNCHNNDTLINSDKKSILACQTGGLIGGKLNAINKTGICGRSKEQMSIDGRKAGLIGGKKGGQIGGKNNTFENRSKAGKIGITKISKDAVLKGLKIINSLRYKCVECDMISTPAGIKSHQKASKHIGKIDMKKTRNA